MPNGLKLRWGLRCVGFLLSLLSLSPAFAGTSIPSRPSSSSRLLPCMTIRHFFLPLSIEPLPCISPLIFSVSASFPPSDLSSNDHTSPRPSASHQVDWSLSAPCRSHPATSDRSLAVRFLARSCSRSHFFSPRVAVWR